MIPMVMIGDKTSVNPDDLFKHGEILEIKNVRYDRYPILIGGHFVLEYNEVALCRRDIDGSWSIRKAGHVERR